MSDAPDELQVQLQALVELHGHEAVSRALARPPGRPKGWTIDDRAAVENMAELLRSGQAETPTGAARQSLKLTEVHSEESAVRRLRDRYKERQVERAARSAVLKALPLAVPDLAHLHRTVMEPFKRFERARQAIEAQARGPAKLAEAIREQMRQIESDLRRLRGEGN